MLNKNSSSTSRSTSSSTSQSTRDKIHPKNDNFTKFNDEII